MHAGNERKEDTGNQDATFGPVHAGNERKEDTGNQDTTFGLVHAGMKGKKTQVSTHQLEFKKMWPEQLPQCLAV